MAAAQVKQSASIRVPVALVSVTDHVTPITGKTGADVTATFLKNDGTYTNQVGVGTLTEGTTGAFASAGRYQLTVPTSASDIVGVLQYAVLCSGADTAFGFVDVVANLASDVKSDTSAIKTKTDNLPATAAPSTTDVTSAITSATSTLATAAALTTVSTNVSSIQAKTDNLPSDPADESLLEAAITAATSPLATSSALTTVGTNVTSIKNKTDNLPTDPADESAIEAAITAATSPLATSTELTAVTSGLATDSDLTTLQTAVTNLASDVSTAQGEISILLAVASGRWKIDTDANTLTLYASNGTTVLYSFDLLDADGEPTSQNIFERLPIAGED